MLQLPRALFRPITNNSLLLAVDDDRGTVELLLSMTYFLEDGAPSPLEDCCPILGPNYLEIDWFVPYQYTGLQS